MFRVPPHASHRATHHALNVLRGPMPQAAKLVLLELVRKSSGKQSTCIGGNAMKRAHHVMSLGCFLFLSCLTSPLVCTTFCALRWRMYATSRHKLLIMPLHPPLPPFLGLICMTTYSVDVLVDAAYVTNGACST
jgi:hypothetical protein